MFPRQSRKLWMFAFLTGILAVCYFTFRVSAENPSAGKTKKAVAAAKAATTKAESAWGAAVGAAAAASSGTKYPDNEAGREATAADSYADSKGTEAEAALKAAAEARLKACKSGTAEDVKAADDAEEAAREKEAEADAASAAADKADSKADPNGKQLQKKKRAAGRALRAAFKAAMAAICFARQCAQLMDESSEQNKQKKQETIQTIDGFNSSTDQLLALGQPARGEVHTADSLHRIRLRTPAGDIDVKLPVTADAGDTISGTVVVEPKGNTEDERKNNAARLSEVKLNFGSKVPKDKKDLMILITPRIITRDEQNSTPSRPNQTNFTTKVPDSFDYTIGVTAPRTDTQTVTITINEPIWFINSQPTTPPRTEPPPSPSDFHFPEIIQQGRTGQISGPNGKKIFDGNSANTRLMYGPAGSSVQDFKKNTENVSGGFGLIRQIAESPYECVFEAPTTIAGPVQFYLKEGTLETVAPSRVVGLNLKGKTDLLKNEHTELIVEVFGLLRIQIPVPLTITAEGVIRLDGGNYQQFVIQPSQVDPQGHYTTKIGGTGVEVGSWTATATVVTQPFNIVLRDPDPPQTLLINSFTGDYVFCGSGPKLTGTGQIKRQGCIIELRDNKPDREVQGTFNSCVPVDNDRFFTLYSPGTNAEFTLTVTDTRPPRRKIYFNPLNRTAPPVQDTSAFATCP